MVVVILGAKEGLIQLEENINVRVILKYIEILSKIQMIINCFFKQSKKIVAVVFLVMASGFLTTSALAKEKINDWYFKNFNSEIEVREDGSLLITETIVADCGDLPGKHGIFRVLPTKIKVDGQGLIEMPVELISIQDQTGKEYKYTTKKDYSRNTIAWKIGDPEKTVKGENIYIIKFVDRKSVV
mgnify:CR=1 FL=1